MTNRMIPALAAALVVAACGWAQQVWEPVDLASETGSKFAVLQSRTRVPDSSEKGFHLDSFSDDWQWWRITYADTPICDLQMGEMEAIVGFWSTGDHLYAHKNILLDLDGHAADLIIRFDRGCKEEQCVDLSGLTADGSTIQFLRLLSADRVEFERMSAGQSIEVVEVATNGCDSDGGQ